MINLAQWLVNSKETLETLALVSGLFYTSASYRADARERRISNLMTLAGSHRDLWMQVAEKPELQRILKKDADLRKKPVTIAEQRFVHLIITHLAVTHAAMKAKVLPGITGLEKDVRSFFSLPIPSDVWKWSREYQEPDFVAFIEDCLRLDEKK